ncbi:MAG: L-threonylcarbamoyladenylate synthase [Nitrospiria bacterium]
MPPKILKLDSANPDSSLLEAARYLSLGKVIIYPTDTIYGIGVDIGNDAAIKKVYQIKKRNIENPILILIEKQEDLLPLVKRISREAQNLIARYWPGPLTLVFKASDKVSPLLTGRSSTIGIRCPALLQTRRLLSLTRFPLTATSANVSGQNAVYDAKEAANIFGDKIDLILDSGPLVSEPSTVLDVTGEKAIIIRQGKLTISLP